MITETTCSGERLLRERGRAAEIGEEDRHRLPLALEAQRIAADDALDDRRRQEPLEAAPAIELEEQRAERDDGRGEHQPVVLPPRERPHRAEELRELRLREQDVRRRESALHREPRADVVATLRPGGDAVERHDASGHQVRNEAGAAEEVGRRVAGAAVRARIVVRVRATADQDPARDATECGRPADRDDGVRADRRR